MQIGRKLNMEGNCSAIYPQAMRHHWGRNTEVYAVTAYLLYLSNVIKENDVMDAKSLPKVPMPNRPRVTASE